MESVGMVVMGIMFIAAGLFIVLGVDGLVFLLVVMLSCLGILFLVSGISGMIKDYDK